MNENPGQKINTLEKRFRDVANDKDLSSLENNSEAGEAIQNELQNILKEVEGIRSRRQELLEKRVLSSEEREEFKLLDEIIKDAQDLRVLVVDLMGDFRITKVSILKTKNLEHIVELKDVYGISNPEIFSSINVSIENLQLSGRLFLPLGKLQISDADLVNLEKDSYNLFKNYVFLLLKYCKLSDQQKEKLSNYVVKCSPFEIVNRGFFALCLSRLELKKEQQESMILELEKFTDNMERYAPIVEKDQSGGAVQKPIDPRIKTDWDAGFSGFTVGFFDVDMLATNTLSADQKRRIASCLVSLGNGLDCQHLLKFYPQFLDQKARQMALQHIRLSPETKNLSIPDLYQATPETFKGKTIHFIVHPFYENFFEGWTGEDLWRECEGDPEKYMEKFAIERMQDLLVRKSKGLKIHADYISLYKTVSAWRKYRTLVADKKNVVIFALPKLYSQDIQGDRYDAFCRILNNFNYGKGNVFYTNTDMMISGGMTGRDRGFIEKVIPKNADIQVSGGYIGACLEAFTKGLVSLQTKRRISLDYSDSVADNLYTLTLGHGVRGSNFLPKTKAFSIVLPSAADVTTLEDVQAIFDQNQAFIQTYERETYDRQGKDRQEETGLHIRHQR